MGLKISHVKLKDIARVITLHVNIQRDSWILSLGFVNGKLDR